MVFPLHLAHTNLAPRLLNFLHQIKAWLQALHLFQLPFPADLFNFLLQLSLLLHQVDIAFIIDSLVLALELIEGVYLLFEFFGVS